MTTSSNKRTDWIADDQAMIAGTQKFLGTLTSLTVGSQTLAPADNVKVFQSRVDAGQAVLTAEAASTAAVAANRAERSKTAAFVQAFRRMVVGMYMQSPDTLAVFNLSAPKVGKKSVATKATAVAKNKATRKARNTMGSEQKKAITGTTAEASTAPAPTTPAATSGSAAASPATAVTKPGA